MSKRLDPFSDLQERFYSCLRQGEESLSRGDTADAAKAIANANLALADLSDLTFRDLIDSAAMNWLGEDKTANPENNMHYLEIFNARHASSYARREQLISGAFQEELERLTGLHAKTVAAEERVHADPAGSDTPPAEEAWTVSRPAGLPKPPRGIKGRPATGPIERRQLRFSLERIARPAQFQEPMGIAPAGDKLLIAGAQGGVDVLDGNGEHLNRFEMDLLRPVGCSAREDGQAFFINSDSRLVKVCVERGLIMQVTLRNELGLPQGAQFGGAAHHAGLTCCPTFSLNPDVWRAATAVWDENQGQARLVPLPEQGIHHACADASGVYLVDAMHFTVARFEAPATTLFRFDPLLLPMHVKGCARGGGMFFIYDTTTLLAFSSSGRLMGRIRPGRFLGRLTNISGIVVSEDASRIHILDQYNKCMFILHADIVSADWPGTQS